MKKIKFQLTLLYFFIEINRKSSQDLIAKFRDFLLKFGCFAPSLEFLESKEWGKDLLRSRVLFDESTLDMDYLRSLPKESLGKQFTAFIDGHKLNPLFYPMHDVRSNEDYIGRRYLQTHDVWHVILGVPPDVMGELELLAFSFAQFRWPIAPFLISGFMFAQIFKSPLKVSKMMEVVFRGYTEGQSSKPFLPIRWEDNWERSVIDLRKELTGENKFLK
jgi:ubiquinone biosynthesis protein COQ4